MSEFSDLTMDSQPEGCGVPPDQGCDMNAADEIQVVERYMREKGYRWTSQRRLISEVVFGSHEHFNAEELLEMCRSVDSQVSRATVYRTLSMMEEAGFVEALETGEGGKRFEHVLGHPHHDHMLCQVCGKILEFRDAELEAKKEAVARNQGFKLISHSLKLLVECLDQDCPGRKEASQVTPLDG